MYEGALGTVLVMLWLLFSICCRFRHRPQVGVGSHREGVLSLRAALAAAGRRAQTGFTRFLQGNPVSLAASSVMTAGTEDAFGSE